MSAQMVAISPLDILCYLNNNSKKKKIKIKKCLNVNSQPLVKTSQNSLYYSRVSKVIGVSSQLCNVCLMLTRLNMLQSKAV